MTYRLFIDDIRDPVTDDWVIARSSEEAIAILEEKGCPGEISFDHDLGGDDTAMIVVKYMLERDLDSENAFISADFVFSVHSANPIGRKNIEGLLGRYLKFRNDED